MKVAIVTGASGAIGSAICTAFKAAGYRVVGTDLEPGAPCDAFLKADLSRLATDERARKATLTALRRAAGKGKLSVLVNNAATQRLGATSQVTQADWDSTLAVNASAPFFLTQAFAKDLEKAQGSVVNVASIHATLTKPGFVAYATSKAALVGLTKALAVDLGGRVRVNAVAPAAVATPMLEAGFKGNPKGRAALESAHPAGRVATPAEVAQAVLQLADGPAFLTGAVLVLDGAIGSRLHDPV